MSIYSDAIQVQDACNLSGVVHAWSRAVAEVWKEANAIGEGTAWVNNHPVNVLFASKVNSLTGFDRHFSEAYAACQAKVAEEIAAKPDAVAA